MAEAYELVFTRDPGQGEQDVVTVRPTGATGPGGHPVYTDASGAIRAEISDRGEVRMLATTGHQDLQLPTAVRALPR
ncbi:DUF6296 family protein [Kitasatospora kifunensis]|uniref:Uncharacterized protein n=1 Tax=Kitasatospora kifunensis TaxID=58351 RepID=A0A7W7QWL4_KITKI|nr:DUF6296 family protein [Kitasatospora kifunensis]MBB4921141.1 hypothetical protein [Kitasatospora kifunensis]